MGGGNGAKMNAGQADNLDYRSRQLEAMNLVTHKITKEILFADGDPGRLAPV